MKSPHDPRWPADEAVTVARGRWASLDAGQAAPGPMREDYSARPVQRYPRTALTGSSNGLPPDRPYRYRERRAAWALRNIAEAAARYPGDAAAPQRKRRAAIDPARVLAAVRDQCG